MRSLRTLQLAVESTHTEVRMCKVGSCQEATREGKTFCTEHIEFQPYIQDLVKRMTDRAQEDESVRSVGSKAVNLDGITVKEILLHLKQGGTRTEERLEREVQLDKVIVHNYLVRLSMEGVIRFGRTGRNNICVRLVDYDPSQSIEDKND
jgi:hypothetical protein